jgi:gas vesicle protein
MDYSIREHENKTSTAWSFFAGALFGGLVGAVTMLLLAPQSGKKTIAQIQQKSIELRDQTSEAVEDVVAVAGNKARHISAGVRKQARELEQQSQAIFDDQKKRWTTLVEAGKSAAQGA